MTAGRSEGRTAEAVKVTARGAERWKQGHPWIYRSDVAAEPEKTPGIVSVTDRRGKFLGRALYSPSSEIRLRLLTRADEPIDARWWTQRIGDAVRRRNGINATAWRAVDQSTDALARGAENARLNGIGTIEWREANAFDLLRELERRGERFDTIVLDPPAFAKTKANLERAVAGYKEINLRAMKILAPGGVLFTSSCSYHVSRDVFNAMVADSSRDSGRRV